MAQGVGANYSEAEAAYVVNHLGADWKAEALEDARNRLEDQGLSEHGVMWYLTEADGFSKAEAAYAVSRVGRDWNAEAVEVSEGHPRTGGPFEVSADQGLEEGGIHGRAGALRDGEGLLTLPPLAWTARGAAGA